MGADWLAMVQALAAFVAAGALAGFAAGLMRTGGGILLAPALLYVLDGLAIGEAGAVTLAVGTALAANTMLSARALLWHARRGSVERAVIVRWAGPVALGGALGGFALLRAPEAVVLAMLAVALVAAGLLMVVRSGIPAGAIRDGVAVAAPLGLALGAVSAVSGAGGGSFGGPLLRWVGVGGEAGHGAAFGVTLGVAALAVAMPLGTASAALLSAGPVSLPGALLVALAAGLAAPHGARIAQTGPAPLLNHALAFLMLATGFALLRLAVAG